MQEHMPIKRKHIVRDAPVPEMNGSDFYRSWGWSDLLSVSQGRCLQGPAEDTENNVIL